MAAVTRKVIKLAAVAGTVPAVGIAIGYRTRALQASENSAAGKRVYKSCDLPLYPTVESESKSASSDVLPRNAVEEMISTARKSVTGFFADYHIVETFDTIKSKTEIGIEHSKASLDFIQNNPGELPRVIFIAVSGMGGVVLGYRGGAIKKITYGTLAALSCAALCYPNRSVEMAGTLSENVRGYLDEYMPDKIEIAGVNVYDKVNWSPGKGEKGTTEKDLLQNIPVPALASNVQQTVTHVGQEESSSTTQRPAGDPGQANPNDKDMYSTRSS